MEKCPRCKAARYRYTFRVRRCFTYMAVACEECGYTGEEVPMKHSEDEKAAFVAADKWNAAAKKAAATEVPRVLH